MRGHQGRAARHTPQPQLPTPLLLLLLLLPPLLLLLLPLLLSIMQRTSFRCRRCGQVDPIRTRTCT